MNIRKEEQRREKRREEKTQGNLLSFYIQFDESHKVIQEMEREENGKEEL